MHDKGKDEHKPSKAHFWGGALTGGATVPFSWAAGGTVTTRGQPGKWENHRARLDYPRFYGAVSRSSL